VFELTIETSSVISSGVLFVPKRVKSVVTGVPADPIQWSPAP
jgi:hypothetical protein